MVGGAAIADALDWRWAFILLGAPGIFVAAIAYITVKEPARGRMDPGGMIAADADVWGRSENLFLRSWPVKVICIWFLEPFVAALLDMVLVFGRPLFLFALLVWTSPRPIHDTGFLP